MQKEGKCSLCGGQFTHYGHNPEPLKRFAERCCDDCNAMKVIPARLRVLRHRDADRIDGYDRDDLGESPDR